MVETTNELFEVSDEQNFNITLNRNEIDSNFFQNQIKSTKYFSLVDLQSFSLESNQNFSILHLNIRSLKKNFESFKSFIPKLNFQFSIICLTETWCRDGEFKSNSNFLLEGYRSFHQSRAGTQRGGGLCIFVHDSLSVKFRKDLCYNNADCESVCVEILTETSKNIIVNNIYRPPAGNIKQFKSYLKNFLKELNNTHKTIFTVGDFNIDLLDQTNIMVKRYLDTLIQNNILPTITKPTRVTRTTSTLIDNILTNRPLYAETGIITTDISDHFPIFLICQQNINTAKPSAERIKIPKRYINERSTNYFRQLLSETDWDLIESCDDASDAYDLFERFFLKNYEKAFPKIEVEIKRKSFENPWMTKGFLKSSKRKQKLYQKFLKRKTFESEEKYKNYKSLFEKIKRNLKKLHYQKEFAKNVGDSKNTWNTIKNIIGKDITRKGSPDKLLSDSNTISNKKTMTDVFNDFFINVGPNLAAKIPQSTRNYKSFLDRSESAMETSPLTREELKTAFNTLKKNKSPGVDDINVNVVKQVFDIIEGPLRFIFKLSLETGIVPDKLKIARVTPIFKAGDDKVTSNYRPISILPCLSKLLERVMYNRLYKHLTNNDLLYEKQFGFQKQHSTEHAVMSLTNDISDAFNNDQYTLGLFIDLSKAFDTVDHNILLTKLENYGVRDSNLHWFRSYLTNRKQRVELDKETSTEQKIKCGVPQGSILGPLLFILYVNDIYKTSAILKFILFADDTNIFFSNHNINELFRIINRELTLIEEWFKCNKLSLNTNKTKYTLFVKPSKRDDLPLKLPDLKINKNTIKRQSTMNFLGVCLDESLSWKEHIKIIENKISKHIAIIYRAKHLLNLPCLKLLYFSFVHSYLTYCNIVWGSTNHTKLKKLHSKQKSFVRLICNKDGDATNSIEDLFRDCNILNIFKINIHQVLVFMAKRKAGIAPKHFDGNFQAISHRYPTRYSKDNYKIPKRNLKVSSYAINFRGPYLWNNFLQSGLKTLDLKKLKKSLKVTLLNSNLNPRIYF